MSPMKRVQKVVLFLVAVALLPCTLALAGSEYVTKLTCVVEAPLDPDYDASGVAKVTHVRREFTSNGFWHTGTLSVHCSGLTPGARYTVWWLGTFTAGANGKGSISGGVSFQSGLGVSVYREDGTTVLVGTLGP